MVADIPVDGKKFREAMKVASEDTIALEPELTRWDTVSLSTVRSRIISLCQIVGDGDCGETCAQGAQGVLDALKEGLGEDGDLVNLFRELTDIIDGKSSPLCIANLRRMWWYSRSNILHLLSRIHDQSHRVSLSESTCQTYRCVLG